jgi:hypothetical protein
MPNELWYWEKRVPADLIPAVKHVRDSFDDALWKISTITHNCCYACLHPDAAASPETREFISQLVLLKGLIGPSGTQLFNDLIKRGTPSAILSAFFHLFEWAMALSLKTAFQDSLAIGSANAARLEIPTIEWAEWHAKSLINRASYQVGSWLKYCCDGLNIHANFDSDSTDDEEEHFWTDWQAPRFASMQPALGLPYLASQALKREDVESSRRLVKTYKHYFVIHLEAKLKDCVGAAHLELAKQPKPAQPDLTRSAPQSGYAEISTDGPVRSTGRAKALTVIEKQRRRVIFGAIQAGDEGPEYCKTLDDRRLKIRAEWIQGGCPKTYEAAYRAGQPWRKRIQDEKSRYKTKYDQTPAAELERLLQ